MTLLAEAVSDTTHTHTYISTRALTLPCVPVIVGVAQGGAPFRSALLKRGHDPVKKCSFASGEKVGFLI